MKARYIGESFGVDSLTNGKIYTILGEDHDMYIVIDDSGEDYLYSKENISKSLENIYILQESKKNINTSLKVHETKTFNHLINSSELYIKQIFLRSAISSGG